MKSAAEHQAFELRARVQAATVAARDALDSFEPAVRALAIKQLAVDADIYSVANAMLMESAKAAPQAAQPIAANSLFTTDEIAERCHVSRDAVAKWLGSGALKKTKAGGRTLISEDDLQDYLRRCTAGNGRASVAA